MMRTTKLAGGAVAPGSRNGSESMAARSFETQVLFRGTQARSAGRLPYSAPAMDVLALGPADGDIVCTSCTEFESDLDLFDSDVEKK